MTDLSRLPPGVHKVGHATAIVGGPAREGRAGHWTQNLKGVQGGRGFGTANKTEVAYGRHLDDLKAVGEVLWWRFHPFTLRLSDTPAEGGGKGKRYTADFLVAYADRVEVHDTKGGYTSDDAWTTLRLAAEVFPVFLFARVRKTKGEWIVERI